MKTIYLHIGQPKTGTKSIQNALTFYKKQGLLEKNNFDFYCLLKDALFLINPKVKDSANYIQTLLGKITQYIQKSNANNIILSFEPLSYPIVVLNESFFQGIVNVFKSYNVKILLYIRRQDTALESLWAEDCKYFRSPLKLPVYNNILKEVLAVYEKNFGKENIFIHVYEKELLYQNDSVCDFLEWVNLDKLIPEKNKISRPLNISLSPQNLRISLSFMRQNQLSEKEQEKRIQELMMKLTLNPSDITLCQNQTLHILNNGINADIDFVRTLLSLYKLEKNQEKRSHAYLPLEERKKYLEECREENEYIAREYLGKEDGILFDETLPDEIISLDSPSTDDLVKSFLPMLVHLKQSVDRLEAENKELKERIKVLEEKS